MAQAKRCPFALQLILPQDATQPRITPTAAVAHTAVDSPLANSLFGWFQNPSAHGAESHFFVRHDGTLEQYMDVDVRADAQFSGNSHCISYETDDDGNPANPWTPEQCGTIERLLTWLNVEWGIPYDWCTSPDSPGQGYHSMFPEWNKDGHNCPGPVRAAQLSTIVNHLRNPEAKGKYMAQHQIFQTGPNLSLMAEVGIYLGVVGVRTQTAPNSGFTGWLSLSSGADPQPFPAVEVTAGTNADGRQEVVCYASDGRCARKVRNGDGSWRNWSVDA